MDDLPRDHLTRGDVDKDGIQAHLYDDYISFDLWSTFCIRNSIQSCCLNSQIHEVNIVLDL